MIPASFEYKRARSVKAAIELLAGGDAKVLSGGHSLVPALKLRLNQPEMLVDIARIASLKGIKVSGKELVIGSTTTHHEIASSDIVKEHLSILAEGAGAIGDVQVRNKGTLGGSLAHADPSADWPALVLVSNAKVVLEGSGGERTLDAADFFTGFFSTALTSDEIITEIRFPIPAKGTKSTYQKFVQPASRFALVGCAVMREPSGETRVAFSGVADAAFRDTGIENAISGKALTAENVNHAVTDTAKGQDIMSDHYASEEYRVHLAKVFAKRALMALA